jgi:carnitine O-acetyltransferase
LARAVRKHKEYTITTMNGSGMDRHLLGLKLIAMESARSETLPSLYDSPAYRKLMHFRVSTSQVPIPPK